MIFIKLNRYGNLDFIDYGGETITKNSDRVNRIFISFDGLTTNQLKVDTQYYCHFSFEKKDGSKVENLLATPTSYAFEGQTYYGYSIALSKNITNVAGQLNVGVKLLVRKDDSVVASTNQLFNVVDNVTPSVDPISITEEQYNNILRAISSIPYITELDSNYWVITDDGKLSTMTQLINKLVSDNRDLGLYTSYYNNAKILIAIEQSYIVVFGAYLLSLNGTYKKSNATKVSSGVEYLGNVDTLRTALVSAAHSDYIVDLINYIYDRVVTNTNNININTSNISQINSNLEDIGESLNSLNAITSNLRERTTNVEIKATNNEVAHRENAMHIAELERKHREDYDVVLGNSIKEISASYNATNGYLTLVWWDNKNVFHTYQIDLPTEFILDKDRPSYYDPNTKELVLRLINGQDVRIDFEGLIAKVEIADTDTIHLEFSETDGKLRSTIRNESLKEEHFDEDLQILFSDLKQVNEHEAERVANEEQRASAEVVREQNEQARQDYFTENKDNVSRRVKAIEDDIPNIKDTLDEVLAPNAKYFIGEQTSVSITLPDNAKVGQEIVVVWYNGDTPATLSIDATMLDFDYEPTARTRTELNALWDGVAWSLVFYEQEVGA